MGSLHYSSISLRLLIIFQKHLHLNCSELFVLIPFSFPDSGGVIKNMSFVNSIHLTVFPSLCKSRTPFLQRKRSPQAQFEAVPQNSF